MLVHNFSSVVAIFSSIPGTQFVRCRLEPALQTPGCLLFTQIGVLSLPSLLLEIKGSDKVRYQVSKEVATSPSYIRMSKSELNYASRRCCLRYAGTILVQIGLIHNSSVSIKRKVSRFMFTSSAIISTVNRRSDMKKFFYPCCVLIFLCCRLWSSELLIFTNGSAFSENILCLRKSCVLDIASFPKAYRIFSLVVLTMSPILT